MTSARPAAAVLLIGDELLSGRVPDANLAFLGRRLFELGVRLDAAAICPDDPAAIAADVQRLAAGSTWLFTTGGIGPTHDDVTMEGIARAFGVRVIVEPRLEHLVRGYFGDACRPAHLRMAWAPEGADLVGDDTGWPTVRMRNVFVLPGVPHILQRKFERIAGLFRQPPLHRRALGFAADEAELAALLAEVAERSAGVRIGSYPEQDRVLVTLESDDAAALAAAVQAVEAATAGFSRAD